MEWTLNLINTNFMCSTLDPMIMYVINMLKASRAIFLISQTIMRIIFKKSKHFEDLENDFLNIRKKLIIAGKVNKISL